MSFELTFGLIIAMGTLLYGLPVRNGEKNRPINAFSSFSGGSSPPTLTLFAANPRRNLSFTFTLLLTNLTFVAGRSPTVASCVCVRVGNTREWNYKKNK